MNSFEEKRQALYNAVRKGSREHGYEPVPGRQLTTEERRESQQHAQEVYSFLEQLRQFEADSRKRRIVARVMVA